MTCCNHNCNQGRTCPHRVRRPVSRADVVTALVTLVAWIGFLMVASHART